MMVAAGVLGEETETIREALALEQAQVKDMA